LTTTYGDITDHSSFREQAIILLLDIGRDKLLLMTENVLTAIEIEGNKSQPSSQQVLDRFIEIGTTSYISHWVCSFKRKGIS
jgi:hypothetical protein